MCSLIFYFLPSVISILVSRSELKLVFVINLLLGWIPPVWVTILIYLIISKLIKMKYLFMVLATLMLLVSCESACDIKEDINVLRIERQSLSIEKQSLNITISDLKCRIERINEELKELNIVKSGEIPQYIITIKIRQRRKGLDVLDVGAQIKDKVNAIKLPIAVSKEYYDKVNNGETLKDEFRMGSALLKGSWSSFELSVIDKQII